MNALLLFRQVIQESSVTKGIRAKVQFLSHLNMLKLNKFILVSVDEHMVSVLDTDPSQSIRGARIKPVENKTGTKYGIVFVMALYFNNFACG